MTNERKVGIGLFLLLVSSLLLLGMLPGVGVVPSITGVLVTVLLAAGAVALGTSEGGRPV